MKRVACVSLLTIILLSFQLPVSTIADWEGPSASGSFQVLVYDGKTQEITFNATVSRDGTASGEITLREISKLSEPKVAAAQSTNGESPAFYAKAVCDCLVVKGIEALIVGTITEASRENYVGRHLLLVVQDGDSITPPLRDKLTFGFYRSITKGWIATDGERSADEQIQAPTWIATDAERPDDIGVLSQKSEEITCESFPISAASFLDSRYGKGKIQVTR